MKIRNNKQYSFIYLVAVLLDKGYIYGNIG
jgi:hypothetical protein